MTEAVYPEVVVDPASNMTVVWYQFDQATFTFNLRARRDHRPGGWDEIQTIANTGNAAFGPGDRLVVDIEGFATVAWPHVNSTTNASAVFVARTTPPVARQHGWGSPTLLASGEQGNPAHLIIDTRGDVIAYWVRSNSTNRDLHFARYENDRNTWTQARSIPDARDVQDEHLAVDSSGNLIALWSTSVPGGGRVQSARLPSDGGTWSNYVTLSASDGDADAGMVGVDGAGNAFAVWNRFDGTREVAQASRYTAATGTWSPAVDLAGLGEDGENVRVAVDSGGNAVVTFHFDNDDDSGEIAQATEWVAAPVALQAPIDLLVVSIDGNTVTLGWSVAAGSLPPIGFVLEGGVSPGEVLASIPTGSAATTFTFVAPTGAFYVRVHALSGASRSAASNEVRIFVNVPVPPAAPENLTGTAVGSTLNLAWRNNLSAGPPQTIVLDVAGSIATSLNLPASAESFSYTSVPPGTYSFTVRAGNATGFSAPSNAIALSFPGPCVPPGPPSGLSATVAGRVVTLSWSAPMEGPPAAYRIEAGSAPGLANLATLDTGTPATTFTTPAPPGVYHVRVRATNPCGVSTPTADITVTVQ